MKKLNKNSLIQKLNEQFVYLNFAIIIFLIIIPMTYYQLFVSSQYYKLERYITQTKGITAGDVGKYVIQEGYDLRSDVGEVFTEKSDVCMVKKVEIHDKTNATSKKLIVSYTNGCDPMVIGLNYILLHGFTIFYFIITIVSSAFVILVNMYNMRGIKKEVNNAFIQVENRVDEIKKIGSKSKSENETAIFSEFQLLVNNIDELNGQINEYIDERHALVSSLNHELKSPINKMNSLIQAYQMNIPGYTDPDVVITDFTQELEILLNIVNFSLDVFVKSNIKDVTEVNVANSIRNVLARSEDKFKLKGLKYKLKIIDELIIESDQQIIELVLSNLTENISKYAKQNSTFTIETSSNGILFRNQIDDIRNTGTQQGLKLSSQLIKSIGYNLEYTEENEEFVVKITRKIN